MVGGRPPQCCGHDTNFSDQRDDGQDAGAARDGVRAHRVQGDKQRHVGADRGVGQPLPHPDHRDSEEHQQRVAAPGQQRQRQQDVEQIAPGPVPAGSIPQRDAASPQTSTPSTISTSTAGAHRGLPSSHVQRPPPGALPPAGAPSGAGRPAGAVLGETATLRRLCGAAAPRLPPEPPPPSRPGPADRSTRRACRACGRS